MALDRYERKDTISEPGVISGKGMRAVADSWDQVGKAGGQMMEMATKEGIKHAEMQGSKEGERAVWVDPETGRPQIVGTLPEGTRPYAEAYRKAAEGRYTAELGLSSLTKVAELGNAAAGNPEAFRNSWAGYAKGITESVPEDIRPGVDLLLKEMGTKKYYQMQMDDFERTKGQAKVSTLNLVDAFEMDAVDTLRTSGLAGGSPEFMADKVGQMKRLLNDQQANGILTPEEANTRIKDFQFRLTRGMIAGEAIKMAKAGKAGEVDKFLDEFKRSPSDVVDDYQRDQIASFARGEVATELAQLKATATAAQDAAKRQVKDAQAVWWKGENYAMDDAEVMRMAQATGDAALIADTQAALAARTSMKEFSLLSPQQQEAALAEAENVTEHTVDTLKLKDNFEALYKQTVTAIDSGDTLQLANNRGLITADPLDFANPATLQKRAADIARVDSQMSAQSNPLLPAEKEGLIKLFDGMDSEGKIALYGSLKEGMGEDYALRAMRQLGQERPAMAFAMGLSDDAPDVARQILMGDLALQADKQVLAGAEMLPSTFNGYVGNAMQGDDTLRNAVYEAARAVYADQVKRGQAAVDDPEGFQKAIDTVTGGIVEYNGFQTIAPMRGMAEGDFEDLIDGMDDGQFRKAAGGRKLVTMGGQEVSADLIHSKGLMEWVGDGQYILKLSIGSSLEGQTVFLADDSGKLIMDEWGRPTPAELDLKPFAGGQ